jgi:hypothetical protein
MKQTNRFTRTAPNVDAGEPIVKIYEKSFL